MSRDADPSQQLFSTPRRAGRRVIITGQVGVDKKPFLEEVASLSRQRGRNIHVAHVGDMMYAEAPDVVKGRILDLPRARLNTLRRAVFKDIIAMADKVENLIVNTHATFRWKHGLFEAFDFDQMRQLDADIYITLVDNVDAVHERLTREHEIAHTLKDIMVWREEEMICTEIIAHATRGHGCYYVLARGHNKSTIESIYRLMFEPQRKKIYPSFPMTHVMNMPDVLADIDAFRDTLAEHFICFDPGDLDEKRLLFEAGSATQRGEDTFKAEVNGRAMTFRSQEVSGVAKDIDGQIVARDFKLIDQSDMIVSYIPELPSGHPALSSGVERELQHALEVTKEVYVIWRPKAEASPFVSETATKLFKSVEEVLAYFQTKGYMGDFQMPLPGTRNASAPKQRGRFG